MMQSVYTAKMGIIAQQKRVDTIANNIANVSTAGFRGTRVTFKDALYSTMQRPVDPQTFNLQQGNGVLVASAVHDFTEGTPTITGISLDFCLQGDGFFTVQDGAGERQYTREGAFAASNEADGNYLVNAQGKYVLDTQGNRIQLPQNSANLTVNAKGELSIGSGTPFATLNIASFENNEGLVALDGNCYVPTASSGPEMQAGNVQVKQGYLESSNVDLASELTKLIRAQRAFSLAGKALATADEMDATANNLRT